MKSQLRLLGGRKIQSPVGQLARPTSAIVREALINILNKGITNSNWLDLYSGSGVIGCEAIERGAKTVLAIELNKRVYKTCHSNLNKIADANKNNVFLEVVNAEANKFLRAGFQKYSLRSDNKRIVSRFDYIYIDPPYKSKFYSSVLKSLVLGDWINKDCLVICEFSVEEGIEIPPQWIVQNEKSYGKTGLLFLTPNQA